MYLVQQRVVTIFRTDSFTYLITGVWEKAIFDPSLYINKIHQCLHI